MGVGVACGGAAGAAEDEEVAGGAAETRKLVCDWTSVLRAIQIFKRRILDLILMTYHREAINGLERKIAETTVRTITAVFREVDGFSSIRIDGSCI